MAPQIGPLIVRAFTMAGAAKPAAPKAVTPPPLSVTSQPLPARTVDPLDIAGLPGQQKRQSALLGD